MLCMESMENRFFSSLLYGKLLKLSSLKVIFMIVYIFIILENIVNIGLNNTMVNDEKCPNKYLGWIREFVWFGVSRHTKTGIQ